MTSARFAVLSLCAIINVVLPSHTAAAVCRVKIFRWISRSVPESIGEEQLVSTKKLNENKSRSVLLATHLKQMWLHLIIPAKTNVLYEMQSIFNIIIQDTLNPLPLAF